MRLKAEDFPCAGIIRIRFMGMFSASVRMTEAPRCFLIYHVPRKKASGHPSGGGNDPGHHHTATFSGKPDSMDRTIASVMTAVRTALSSEQNG